jgi:uncharacterized protein (TIGR03435 family)
MEGNDVVRGGRYELHNATLVDLIKTAYTVEADAVVGGPSWLATDRFDVIAKPPANAPPASITVMLQSLLADRFKLVVHQDTRALAAYSLTVGGGKPKLKETEGGNTGCQGQPQTETGGVPLQVVTCRNMTMAALAEQLPRMAGAYLQNPVVDNTGLKQSWDFELKWMPRALLAQAGADAITIFDALDKQLGLKLELQKIPASAFIVDSVNRNPSDNPPGVAAIFPPPPPPEFEVVDIKPSPPGAPGPMARVLPTGQVNASGMPLRQLINLAWNINGDDLIDVPKWTESAKFDIVGKAFSNPADAQQIDIEILQQMLRALLVDRFKIKTHMEDRPVSGYILMVASPKLTKADPASRTRCTEGPAVGARDPRNSTPILARLITCQNMTMAQFAERLPQLAGGYVRTPVADATGLEGGWDFTVNFSPIGLFQGGGAGRGGDAGPAGPPAGGALSASEPNGAISLPEAINRQLGLKLEMQKRPMSVLVFDHIEEKPTEN